MHVYQKAIHVRELYTIKHQEVDDILSGYFRGKVAKLFPLTSAYQKPWFEHWLGALNTLCFRERLEASECCTEDCSFIASSKMVHLEHLIHCSSVSKKAASKVYRVHAVHAEHSIVEASDIHEGVDRIPNLFQQKLSMGTFGISPCRLFPEICIGHRWVHLARPADMAYIVRCIEVLQLENLGMVLPITSQLAQSQLSAPVHWASRSPLPSQHRPWLPSKATCRIHPCEHDVCRPGQIFPYPREALRAIDSFTADDEQRKPCGHNFSLVASVIQQGKALVATTNTQEDIDSGLQTTSMYAGA